MIWKHMHIHDLHRVPMWLLFSALASGNQAGLALSSSQVGKRRQKSVKDTSLPPTGQ